MFLKLKTYPWAHKIYIKDINVNHKHHVVKDMSISIIDENVIYFLKISFTKWIFAS